METTVAAVVHPDEIEPLREAAGAEVRETFGPHNGCARLEQRVIELAAGRYEEPPLAGRQTLLYVTAGRGVLFVEGREEPLDPELGAFVPSGSGFALAPAGGEPLRVVAVRTPADERAPAGKAAIVRFADQPELTASEERTYRLLVNEDVGCSDVTQFVGIVQPSKAAFHSHPYDEVGYIIRGQGTAYIGEAETPLRSGSCFHLAPGRVHCIENSGTEPMLILGVFHPSGSPANRAYPDNNGEEPAS